MTGDTGPDNYVPDWAVDAGASGTADNALAQEAAANTQGSDVVSGTAGPDPEANGADEVATGDPDAGNDEASDDSDDEEAASAPRAEAHDVGSTAVSHTPTAEDDSEPDKDTGDAAEDGDDTAANADETKDQPDTDTAVEPEAAPTPPSTATELVEGESVNIDHSEPATPAGAAEDGTSETDEADDETEPGDVAGSEDGDTAAAEPVTEAEREDPSPYLEPMNTIDDALSTGDSGNYPPGRESINLPPMAFDGMEAEMVSSLIPHATVFLEDLSTATEVDNAYSDAGPGDMDTLAWIKAAPRAASEVKRSWNQRLGIVGTNNLAVNILAASESGGRDIPLDPTCTEFAARLTAVEDGKDFMHASQIAYQLYLEGFDADETETARVTHEVRTSIHHLYMTEILSRIIKLGATDEQILAVTGQRSLGEGQIDFISQQRELA